MELKNLGYDQIPTFASCVITFAASAATSKRDNVIGQFNGWDVESKLSS
jgi:hypothetical protein